MLVECCEDVYTWLCGDIVLYVGVLCVRGCNCVLGRCVSLSFSLSLAVCEGECESE